MNAGGVIYNAPMIAFNINASDINFPNGNVDYSKVHDQVLAIDPVNMTMRLNLINGFSFGRPVWYISMDASIPLAAAIEHNTYAPLMTGLHLGDDDSFNSPIERIFIATNGAETGGCDNPLRQGLSADLADGYRPNNTLGGIPTLALDYSPAWDANLYEWTQAAITGGYRGQLREEIPDPSFRSVRPAYGSRRGCIWERGLFNKLSHRSAARLSEGCARRAVSARDGHHLGSRSGHPSRSPIVRIAVPEGLLPVAP
jgi:hypothetical protein